MDMLTGKQLIRKSGDVVSADTLRDTAVIAYYFSAHWCPPCRMFTPILADFYQDVKNDEASFEIIFVSSDQSPAAMMEYFRESHGDWLALPHDSPLGPELKKKYGVRGIPMLVVVKTDGAIITSEGRNDVHTKGITCFKNWTK